MLRADSRTKLLAGIVALLLAPGDAAAQARRLTPADFVVAGVPDFFPDVEVEADTARIRRILGNPAAVRRHEFMPGDTMTTWEFDGLHVTFGGISRLGITLVNPRVATARGLRVGDSVQRVRELYGTPAIELEDEMTYADPREHLHVIQVMVKAGRVTSIFVGNLWD